MIELAPRTTFKDRIIMASFGTALCVPSIAWFVFCVEEIFERSNRGFWFATIPGFMFCVFGLNCFIGKMGVEMDPVNKLFLWWEKFGPFYIRRKKIPFDSFSHIAIIDRRPRSHHRPSYSVEVGPDKPKRIWLFSDFDEAQALLQRLKTATGLPIHEESLTEPIK